MSFVNPTRNQDHIYLNPELKEQLNLESRQHADLKYSSDRALEHIEYANITDYISGFSPRHVDEDVELAQEIDSFTAPELLSDIISSSEIADIQADPENGLYEIRTYKTIEDDEGWTFWTAYLNNSSGEVVGQVSPAYQDECHSYSHSVQNPYDADFWVDDNILEAAYVLARETVPDVPDYKNEKNSADEIAGQFEILEGSLGLISQLEETGEVEVDKHAQIGSNGPRGGELGNTINNFINLAKKAGIIDYTVSNENKENRVKIESGGYKFLTRDLSQLGFSSSRELIDSRTIPAWK